MGDDWFDVATLDHFWIQRRFAVLKRLAGGLISGARELAEVGCGHGLLQLQIERAYSRGVTGLDLNEFALKRNQSDFSPVCCYDIHQRNPDFKQRFDVIFLFDVLEHIEDENQFLDSLLFHLAPEGNVIVNVPAGQWLFSPYDIAAGHKRRYSIAPCETLPSAISCRSPTGAIGGFLWLRRCCFASSLSCGGRTGKT